MGRVADIRSILERTTTIAVVGFSTQPAKTAHRIPALVKAAGFRVIPVHPWADEILGEQAYPLLADVPVPIDMVNVFRPSGEATGVVHQAIAVGAKAIWLQLGITSAEGRQAALAAGIDYVEDLCLGVEVRQLGIRKSA
jgi:predicted CoA-binding protein